MALGDPSVVIRCIMSCTDRAMESLIARAQGCKLCPRMAHSRRVLTTANGSFNAKVLFVGEAPGRLGAERTGIPFCGDRSGERFEQLLAAMKWNRADVFITNAVICNPRDAAGNNDVPNRTELSNCSQLLRSTIDMLNPSTVIAVGNVALESLRSICHHTLLLREAAGRVFPWHGRRLGVLYHPGPRSAVHRSWELQIRDAVAVAESVSSSAKPRRNQLLDLYE